MNDYIIRNAVGKRIRQLRLEHGMSQERFIAKLNLCGINISRTQIIYIEQGSRAVRDTELYCIAKIFKVNMEDLFSQEDLDKIGISTDLI